MSMIISKKDLQSSETRQQLMDKIMSSFDEFIKSTDESYQIDIYPVKQSNYYTTGEVAKAFQVSDRMVRKWCEKGTIQALQTPGGAWRIYVSQFPDLSKVEGFQKAADKINERFREYPEIDDFE